jgi:hypothetical protein
MTDNSDKVEGTSSEQAQDSTSISITDTDDEQSQDTVRRTRSNRPAKAGYGIFSILFQV